MQFILTDLDCLFDRQSTNKSHNYYLQPKSVLCMIFCYWGRWTILRKPRTRWGRFWFQLILPQFHSRPSRHPSDTLRASGRKNRSSVMEKVIDRNGPLMTWSCKKLPTYNVPGVSLINQRVLPFIFSSKKKLVENIFNTCTFKQIFDMGY